MSLEAMFPEFAEPGRAVGGFWDLVAFTTPYSTSAARVRPGNKQEVCQPRKEGAKGNAGSGSYKLCWTHACGPFERAPGQHPNLPRIEHCRVGLDNFWLWWGSAMVDNWRQSANRTHVAVAEERREHGGGSQPWSSPESSDDSRDTTREKGEAARRTVKRRLGAQWRTHKLRMGIWSAGLDIIRVRPVAVGCQLLWFSQVGT